MSEAVSTSKLLDITPSTLIKTTSSTIKGLLVIGAIAGIGWAIYAGIIRPVTKPNPSTTQNAEQITNYNFQPKQTFFGCANWKLPKPEKEIIKK